MKRAFMRGAFLPVCAVCATVFVAASSARAQVIQAYFGPSPVQRTDGGQVVGVSFNSFGGTISSLGFFDFGSDGLASSYQVGLWDSSQNLIDSVTITNSSTLFNEFRYEPITPVTFGTFANPQTFTIGAMLPANMSDVWLNNVFMILASGFAGAGTGQYTSPAATLVYPATTDTTNYIVVNANGPVPEPTSATILMASAGLALARRHRRR